MSRHWVSYCEIISPKLITWFHTKYEKTNLLVNPLVIRAFFPFHTWFDFSFLITRMEIINKFAKTRVNILNFPLSVQLTLIPSGLRH